MDALIMALELAVAPCSWNKPGSNRYRGDLITALNDYHLDPLVQEELADKLRHHQYDDDATITRQGIAGDHGSYANLRDMHFGAHSVCHGGVNQTAWTSQQVERGLVYCVGSTCVIVPTICNNLALVDRREGEEPIDISPAAGGADGGGLSGPPAAPRFVDLAEPQAVPVEVPTFNSVVTSVNPGGTSPVFPTLLPPGGIVGEGPIGCRCTPVISSPVPEPGSLELLLAGLAGLIWCKRRR